jgi:hypothetical protein
MNSLHTVADLIKALAAYPQHLPVSISTHGVSTPMVTDYQLAHVQKHDRDGLKTSEMLVIFQE